MNYQKEKEVTIESSEGLKSNTKIEYVIKFYDKNGKELKVKIIRERQEHPSKTKKVTVKIKRARHSKCNIRTKLTNKDNKSKLYYICKDQTQEKS